MTWINLAFLCFFLICAFSSSEGRRRSTVPALYVLGDSLVDVGNNNYINTPLHKANFPYYGIDYPGGRPTGRFTNGKNTADFLAEKLGLPTPPPYLSNTSYLFLKGASFGSGGSGIFNNTGQVNFFMKILSLATQVDYFTTLQGRLVQSMGAAATQQHLCKSLFTVVIGSNDISAYFRLLMKPDPDQYVDEMVSVFKGLLKKMYSLGARKFIVPGLASLGCTPAGRLLSSTSDDCYTNVNNMALSYNRKLTTMLAELKSSFNDFKYSYFDNYTFSYDIIQNPAKYGFKEVKTACCGSGELNAVLRCSPLTTLCPNRSDHLFWDRVHPTQAANKIVVNTLFTGSRPLVTPLNVQQLIAL